MSCTATPFAGGTAILCQRGRRAKACQCGAVATKLCDFLVTRRGALATCDKPLCEGCAVPVDAERDYCASHHRYAEQLASQGREARPAPLQRELDLDRHAPLARRTDPDSSHEAVERLERSGELSNQEAIVERLVFKYPGLSTKELAQRTGVDRYLLARRMASLADKNRVHRTKIPGEDLRCWPGPRTSGAG